MSKKRDFGYRSFESRNKSGRFVRISLDMLNTNAWRALKPIAVKLYVYLKTKYNGSELSIEFECPYSEIHNKIGFGDKSTKSAFDDLIEKGFVEIVENNKSRMKANKYRFSDRWQQYGAAPYYPNTLQRQAVHK